ncbi:MAG TPA: hypothetical protein VNA23_11140 [Anaerolineales bacterium]|nr:hypothetical protein [Anaerolineales bacterium]
MKPIPNSQLSETDPPARSANWQNIQTFAITFDGYEHWGSFKKCREVADLDVSLHRKQEPQVQSLTGLRTCLFFESRRWKHLEKAPTKKAMGYIHALVEQIRVRVLAKTIT